MKRSTNLLFYGIVPLLLIGCGEKVCTMGVRTEYVEVPMACKVTIPKAPEFNLIPTGNIKHDEAKIVRNIKKLLNYADQLEMALYCCTEDPRCVTNRNSNE